jgi:hypothetical protein
MNIYYLEVLTVASHGWGFSCNAVVIAASPTKARALVSAAENDPPDIWTNPEKSSCEKIGEATGRHKKEPGVVSWDHYEG